MNKILTILFFFTTAIGYAQRTQIVQGAASASATALKATTTTALQSATRAGKTTAIVTDAAAGGTFNYSSASLTNDNGITFAASGGGHWVRDISNASGVHVSWFGTDSTAIAQALAATTDNGTLYFQEGVTYSIPNKINFIHPVNVQGHNAILSVTTANKTAISIQSSNVTIDGLEVKGAGNASYNSAGQLIKTEGSSESTFYSNITIQNCKIHSNTYGALYLWFVINVKIDHNEIYDFPYEGVFLFSCRDGKITNNIITNIHGTGTPGLNAYGISATANLITDTAYVSKNIEISGNHIKDVPTWEGIDTHGGQNLTIRNNHVENCKYAILVGNYNLSGVLSTPRNIIIDNNTINQEPFVAGRYAITFASADSSLAVSSGSITNNKMYGAGIEIVRAQNVNIDNNKIIRGGNAAGLYVVSTNTGITITNNYFEDIYSDISGNSAAILVANTDTLVGFIGANTLKRSSFTNPYGYAVNQFGIYLFSAGSTINFAENDFSGASTQANRYAGSIEQPFRLWGTGSPQSVIQAPIGSQWTRSDGTSVSTLYLKEGPLISDWAALSTPSNFLVGSSLSVSRVPYYSASNTFSNSDIERQSAGNGINVNFASIGRSGTGYAWMGNNVSYTGTNFTYNYRFTDYASGWDFSSGNIYANTAGSGTQGNPITFSIPLSIIQANGRIGIGTIIPTQKLHVVGQVRIDSLNTGTTSDSLVVDNNGTLKRIINPSIDGLSFTTVGKGLTIKSGTGQRAGNATLVGGTITVANTTVTANTLVNLTRKTAGGTVGNITYTLSAGVSFTITSDSGTDTSTYTYLLTELN